MQKILIICPTYGNAVEALSVHTKMMKSYFSRHFEVAIMATARQDDSATNMDPEPNVRLIELAGAWNFISLITKQPQIKEFDPDKIFIQYVPFLYGRGGINLGFPLWVMLMRIFSRASIEIYCHELYYPFEIKLKSMVMHFSHIIMLLILGISAHKILVTTRNFEKLMKRLLFFKKKIYWLPVGPNIEKTRVDDNACEAFRIKHSIAFTDFVLGSFGTFHPSKNYHLIFKILMKIKTQAKIPIKFIMIGQDEEKLLKYLGEDDFHQLKGIVITTGQLDDSEVNIAFAVMDLYLGYFTDGLTTRRGSIMAAMQAGLPIISTIGHATEECFIKQPQIYLYDPDEKIFFDAVMELIMHYGYQIKKNGKTRHVVFEEMFAWEKIFQSYQQSTGISGG